MKECSICEQGFIIQIWGRGNNAMPINDGYCCNECDNEIVTPVRFAIEVIMREHWKNLNHG